MALLWMDGFDKYSADADLANRNYTFTANSHFQATAGRNGGGAIQAVGTGDADFNIPIAVTGGTIFHTAGWYKFTAGVPIGNFIKFFDSGRTQWGGLKAINGDGTLQGVKWQGTGDYSSAAGILNADTYQHIETAIQFADAGFFKVWVDGTLVINITGDITTNTGNGADIAWMSISKATVSGPTDTKVDDLVIWDESGTVYALTQLGLHKIETLTPSGAGSHADFTPSAGSNYQNVDDAGAHNGDTDYNETTTLNGKDSYAIGDLSSTPNAIYGVQVVSQAKYINAANDVKNLLRSGTTEATGTQTTLQSAYKPVVDFWSKDPATAAAFTAAGVNGLEIGITKVT